MWLGGWLRRDRRAAGCGLGAGDSTGSHFRGDPGRDGRTGGCRGRFTLCQLLGGERQRFGHFIRHARVQRQLGLRLQLFRRHGTQGRVEAAELPDPRQQGVAHGANDGIRQAGQRHQLGAHPDIVDGSELSRIEVGGDLAALVVGMLLEQFVDLLPFDRDEAHLAAANQIADRLARVAHHHEGGVQCAVTESLQRGLR